MTTREKMEQVLRDSGLFTIQDIHGLFCDAQVGMIIRISNGDDEDEDEEDDEEENLD